MLVPAHDVFAQWTPYPTVSKSLIWNIAFADENTVYAVGPGLLMKSSNAGRNWSDLLPTIAALTTNRNIFNLYFLNKDSGFVFMNGQQKNVFKTVDGGHNWIDVSQDALSSGLLDMQFVNAGVGYATCGYLANDSTLAKTTDGGITWYKMRTPAPCFAPMALHFLNEQVGFYGENEIYKTMDGGVSWKLTTASPGWITGHRISAYKFVDGQSGYAITDEWDLYKTGDGGENWSLVTLPVSGRSGCRGLDFDQNNLGYIGGYAFEKLLISSDGGTSWYVDASFPDWELPSCVAVSPDHKVIVGTREGDVVVRENGPLAAPELKHRGDLTISPNPANGKIMIRTTSGIRSVEIANSLGQTLRRISPDLLREELDVDLDNYSSGIYFIKVSTGDFTTSRKVVLQ
jgi:photosystem II stability/assembly factor-like uncharacterized protein